MRTVPNPNLASTAPWDQPRKATTVTLRFPGARAATEAELLAHLVRESPTLSEPAIELIHGHAQADANCCLISWRNKDYRG
jgi:hypothetical protein